MGIRFKFKYIHKPTRNHTCGVSPSEFKTFLKRNGFKVSRKFFYDGAIAIYNNRFYRFRFFSSELLNVDISCPIEDFDRWANSVDELMTLQDFYKSFKE